jgi:hypothetical protein
MKQFLIGVLVGIVIWSAVGELLRHKEQVHLVRHNCLPDPFIVQWRHNPQLVERFRYFVKREYGWEFKMVEDSLIVDYGIKN